MSTLLHYSTMGHSNLYDFFASLASMTDFWDSIEEENNIYTYTKGDLSLTTPNDKSISISGYGTTFTLAAGNSGTSEFCYAAATSKGFIMGFANTASVQSFLTLGLDENTGKWAAATGSYSSNTMSISGILGYEVSATTYSQGNTIISINLMQLCNLTSQKGSVIFSEVYRVLMTPNVVYHGKLQIGDNKYVKLGPFALEYTE